MQRKAIVIDPADNVANLVGPGQEADPVTITGAPAPTEIALTGDIPSNHKIALRPIAKGELVTKYGVTIGRATCDIAAGEHVHVHNIESLRGRGDLASRPQ